MTRRTENVAVPKFDTGLNRDLGKLYLITEWDAATAEKWGIKMTLALNRSSGEIPMDLRGIGMEGVAIIGLNTFLRGNISPAELIPLLDELLECVKVIRDPRYPEVATPIASPDDIEEIATRLWLRSEVLRVHTNFSPAEALSRLWARIMTPKPPDLLNT